MNKKRAQNIIDALNKLTASSLTFTSIPHPTATTARIVCVESMGGLFKELGSIIDGDNYYFQVPLMLSYLLADLNTYRTIELRVNCIDKIAVAQVQGIVKKVRLPFELAEALVNSPRMIQRKREVILRRNNNDEITNFTLEPCSLR